MVNPDKAELILILSTATAFNAVVWSTLLLEPNVWEKYRYSRTNGSSSYMLSDTEYSALQTITYSLYCLMWPAKHLSIGAQGKTVWVNSI